MPLVNAKCTNCGANLNVDSSKEAAVCEYCGSAFIVEKAINNYNVNANVVNIYSDNSAEFVIRAGTLEKYIGKSTDVIIPNTVNYIGDSAFKDCVGLKKVKIPNSITNIGNNAFYGCNNLEDLIIPDSVIFIGNSAFYGCKSLTSVTIPKETLIKSAIKTIYVLYS